MDNATVIMIMGIVIAVLAGVMLYQRIVFQKGTQRKLRQIEQKLREILDNSTDEKVMVFTDNSVLIDLAAQINRILVDRQRMNAEYRRSELSSKKMLSNISHDIKTPMTVILGYLEIMRLTGQEDKKLLDKVEMKAQKVMELINQFFTLAKLEAGDMHLELTKINISEVCRENILDFFDILTQKEIQVEINIPEQPYYVQGNKDALQRIFFNIISNAVRYGSEGKYLGVFLRENEKNVFIEFVDKGQGIDPAFAETIFERLFTMEDSRNKEIQGNGLGLTIAKNLANQMDGDILVESKPYVRTIFTVKLKKILY